MRFTLSIILYMTKANFQFIRRHLHQENCVHLVVLHFISSFVLRDFFKTHQSTVTLIRGARECYHVPNVNSQTSGGKETSYFSILDWLQAKSNRFPNQIPTSTVIPFKSLTLERRCNFLLHFRYISKPTRTR
jgi:hypothetical protein